MKIFPVASYTKHNFVKQASTRQSFTGYKNFKTTPAPKLNNIFKDFLDRKQQIAFLGACTLTIIGFASGNPFFSLLGALCGFCGALPNIFLERNLKEFDPILIDPVRDRNLTHSQKICKNVFLENYSAQESKNIINQYKDIMKISDKENFIRVLFNSLTKDYKLNNIPIKLINSDRNTSSDISSLKANGWVTPDYSKQVYELHLVSSKDRNKIMETLVHELHHIKQEILAYQASQSYEERVGNDILYIKSYFKSSNKYSDKFYPSESAIKEFAKTRMNQKDRMFNSLGIYSGTIKGGDFYRYAKKVTKTKYPSSAASYLSLYEEQDAIRAGKMFVRKINL